MRPFVQVLWSLVCFVCEDWVGGTSRDSDRGFVVLQLQFNSVWLNAAETDMSAVAQQSRYLFSPVLQRPSTPRLNHNSSSLDKRWQTQLKIQRGSCRRSKTNTDKYRRLENTLTVSHTSRLVVVDTDSFQLKVWVAMVSTSWVNTMFIGDHLPELHTQILAPHVHYRITANYITLSNNKSWFIDKFYDQGHAMASL